MKVIVVGNGPTLLDVENGHLIDQFDIVVRFNDYSINRYEKYVGTKTDYWFNTINYNNKEGQPRLKHAYKKIVWHCWAWDPEKDNGYQSFLKFFQGKNVNFFKTEKKTIEELQEYANDKQYFNYSTGLIAIWMLLKEFDSLTITGFDWWKSGIGHHYNDKAPRGTIHKPEKELLVIQKLIEENKIKFL
jgi:hypothetical protein